jgi:putative ABC transport system permease protein
MFFRTLLYDLRLTVRHAGRAKAFYLSAVMTLALGMAGAIVMFTLVRGILLRPLPVPDEDRLVVSWRIPQSGVASHVPYRSADVEEIGRASRSFEKVTGVGYNGSFDQDWRRGDVWFTARTVAVMGGFFEVAGVRPQIGRALTVEDDRRGAERMVVLSHAAWLRLFGASSTVLGQTLHLQNTAFTIAGVMPPDFAYPSGSEIWTTLNGLADIESNEDFHTGILRDVEILGRLRSGVTADHATAELAAMLKELDARTPGAGFVNFRPVVRPFKDMVVGDIDTALSVLFAAVGLILAIAGANVANLLLMRGEGRRTELAVRAALGASRSRLTALLLAESLVIALAAASVGLGLARWGLQTVVTLVPQGLPRPDSIRIDATVIAFATGLAFLAATLAGSVPALTMSRLDLASCLRAGGRGTAGAASARGRRLLVAAQVALAVTIVAAAGLLVRSVQRLQTVDLGLAADRLVLVELDLPRDRYADSARRRSFHEDVVVRVGLAPGIESVTALNVQPFAGATGWDLPRFTAEGQTADQVALNPSLNFEAVYPAYFSTLGVTIQRGRQFTAADREGMPRVAIVSDALAQATWPGQDPIGKRLKFGGLHSRDEWLTVVGVAATTRYRELATPRPTLYVPTEQLMISGGRLAIRTVSAPAFVADVVRGAVQAVDPAVRVTRIAPYAEYLRVPLAWPRFNALLLVVFAVAALLLSAVGLYGVMAASVRQRQGEIGIRVALGATAADVRRLVLGEGVRLAVAGAIAGLVLTLAVTRVLRGLLFETEPLDPVSLVTAALVLVGAALVATWLPARRATRVDPIEVLRAQ